MSALAHFCDVCPRPGSCCKNIRLFDGRGEVTFWVSEGDEAVRACLDAQDIPFTFATRDVFKEQGQEYRTLTYQCPRLLPTGRCGDYANRPHLCRIFEAGADTGCVLSKHPVHPDAQIPKSAPLAEVQASGVG